MNTPRRFLVVDDNETTRDQYVQILRLEGYDVECASDVASALAWLESREADAVLLDWHLPDGNAADALRQIRASKKTRDVPIVVVTGDYFLNDTVPGVIQAFGAQLRFKPLWADELVDLARQLVST